MLHPPIPRCCEAIADANRLDTAYDGDEWSRRLDGAFSDLFGTEVRAFWVTTGTAANCLALAALCPPYRAHPLPQGRAYRGRRGRRARLLHRRRQADPARRGRRQADARRRGRGLRAHPQRRAPGPARGDLDHQRDRIWPRVSSIRSRRDSASSRSEHGLALHMDGARLANALVSTGDSLADMTWRAGVDALSFGFVKNGGLNAEALILFRTELADEIAVRRKRAGHLLSKGRYLAAQLLAMLDGRPVARQCAGRERGCAMLARAAPDRLVYPVEANEIFFEGRPAAEAARLRANGFRLLRLGLRRNPARHQLGPAGRAARATRRRRSPRL